MGHCLHIVDNGRAAVESKHGREIRWLDARVPAFALKGFDEAGLFTTHVTTAAAMHDNFDGTAFSGVCFCATKALGTRFLDGALEYLCTMLKLTADINENLPCLNSMCSDECSFQQLVRVAIDNLPVLKGSRLRFVGVDNEVNRLAGFPIEKAPFNTGGEPCPAASAEAGLPDFPADLHRRHGKRLL